MPDIVRHINCEIAAAIYTKLHGTEGTEKKPDPLWQHLVEDNFVGAVNLSLEVSDSANIDPNLSFIHPIAGGMSQSRTLSVVGQYNTTRDSTLTLAYVVDLPELVKKDPHMGSGACVPGPGGSGPAPDANRGFLGGTLNLKDVLDTGLASFEATSIYSKYGADGPAAELAALNENTSNIRQTTQALRDASAKIPLTQKARGVDPTTLKSLLAPAERLLADPARIEALIGQTEASRQAAAATEMADTPEVGNALAVNGQSLEDLLGVLKESNVTVPALVSDIKAASAAGSAKPAPTGQSGSGFSFSDKIDFIVTTGLSGGPTWSLTHFKGPGGGGGSGGGGSGGSGGGGGGGNGGQNLLNYSNTATDTLTVTFEASCRNDPAVLHPAGFWDSIATCGAKSKAQTGADAQTKNEYILARTPPRAR